MLTLVGRGYGPGREARCYALARTLAVRARSAAVVDMEMHLAVYAGLLLREAVEYGRTKPLGRVEGLGRRIWGTTATPAVSSQLARAPWRARGLVGSDWLQSPGVAATGVRHLSQTDGAVRVSSRGAPG